MTGFLDLARAMTLVPGGLGRLFRRYAARHLRLSASGPVLIGGDGRAVGRITRIALVADRLVVEGHVDSPQITLRLGDRVRRAQLEASLAGPGGFRLDLPWQTGPARVEFGPPDDQTGLQLAAFAGWRLALGRLALVPGFVWCGLTAVPAVLRWMRFRDPLARIEVRDALGLRPVETDRPLDPSILTAAPSALRAVPTDPVTLILPVYQATADTSLLAECLDRVGRHSDLPWHMFLIDDASPEAATAALLDGFARRHPDQVTLLRNDRNLGFIGTVNRGLALAAGRQGPVVLLNSDALVPLGWLSRLTDPIMAAPDQVASVTPMSNDAELGCVPVICAPRPLPQGVADRIDAAAQNLAPALTAGPTGVGFCMALGRPFLTRVPSFDTAFGRGYGEEVDWCQKAAHHGGRHLYHSGLFVEHRGGASFGDAEKRRLLQRNGAEISRRYPRFDAEVQQFLAEDPLLTPRLALGLAFAAACAEPADGDGAVPVYVGHAMGGGAEHWLANRLSENVRRNGAAVVLRLGGPRRWRIELHSDGGVTWGDTGDLALVTAMLERLPRRRVIYSCGVGDPDPAQLPQVLLALSDGAVHRLEILFHDYFPISPSFTLLSGDGLWHGLPAPDTSDRAHQIRRPDGQRLPLADWQAAWGEAVRRADRLVVFSQHSAHLVQQVWPNARDRLEVCPHPVRPVPRLTPPAPDARPVIGVLGNIGAHKGATVLQALARRLSEWPVADLVLIGELDPLYSLAAPARVHGPYRIDDLGVLAKRYKITCWLIPSIWPETFSFTTHEAIATSLPVWCFDLGAQAEAVLAARTVSGKGGVIPLQGKAPDADSVLAAILAVPT